MTNMNRKSMKRILFFIFISFSCFTYGQTYLSYNDSLKGNVYEINEFKYSYEYEYKTDSIQKKLESQTFTRFYKNNLMHYRVITTDYDNDSTIYFYENDRIAKEYRIMRNYNNGYKHKNEIVHNYFDNNNFEVRVDYSDSNNFFIQIFKGNKYNNKSFSIKDNRIESCRECMFIENDSTKEQKCYENSVLSSYITINKSRNKGYRVYYSEGDVTDSIYCEYDNEFRPLLEYHCIGEEPLKIIFSYPDSISEVHQIYRNNELSEKEYYKRDVLIKAEKINDNYTDITEVKFEYDKQGNWTKMSSYLNKTLRYLIIRDIRYYD